MSTDKHFAEFILDQVNDVNVRVHKMFGEYALYWDNRVVGLICNNTVYVKITEKTTKILGENYQTGFAYPGAKASFWLDSEILENRDLFRQLLRECSKDVPVKKTSR